MKVLEKHKCFKAYYRLGIALLKKQKTEKAIEYLEKASSIGNNDEKKAAEPYIKECQKILQQNNNKDKDKEENKKKVIDNTKKEDNTEPINNKEENKSKLDKMEEILQKEKDKNQKNDEEEIDEIKIDTIEKSNNSAFSSSQNVSNSTSPLYNYPNLQNNPLMPNQEEQAKEKIKSMSDSELN